MKKYHIIIDIVRLEFDHLRSGLIPNILRIANEGESARMEQVFPALLRVGSGQHSVGHLS